MSDNHNLPDWFFDGIVVSTNSLEYDELVSVSFDSLESVRVNGQVAKTAILLKADVYDEKKALSIPYPPARAKYYSMIFGNSKSDSVPMHSERVSLRLDVMDELQQSVGVYIRQIIIKKEIEERLTCWVNTTTITGDECYYRLPSYLAVAFAISHSIPIKCEEKALLEHSFYLLNERYSKEMNISFSNDTTLSKAIKDSEGDVSTALKGIDVNRAINEISLEELNCLKQYVIHREWYEWAIWISDKLKEKTANHFDKAEDHEE